MKLRSYISVCLVALMFVVSANNGYAAAEDDDLTDVERKEAQQTAQRFVKRMQETRDVAALVDELFVRDFTSHLTNGGAVAPELYQRLDRAERLQLFSVWYNLSYLNLVDIQMNKFGRERYTDEGEEFRFKSILPVVLAEKLQRILSGAQYYTEADGDDRQFLDRGKLLSWLTDLEAALSEARVHLAKQNIEQTTEFQKELNDIVLGTGINYPVNAYIGGGSVKDSEPLIGYPADAKFFHIDTPLIIAVILVKEDGKMKIANLTFADGD